MNKGRLNMLRKRGDFCTFWLKFDEDKSFEKRNKTLICLQ